jgi:hypothetical protein
VEYFQAGHASSILVTRSKASLLFTALLKVPKLFEQVDDKNGKAGHASSMIMSAAIYRSALSEVTFGPLMRALL